MPPINASALISLFLMIAKGLGNDRSTSDTCCALLCNVLKVSNERRLSGVIFQQVTAAIEASNQAFEQYGSGVLIARNYKPENTRFSNQSSSRHLRNSTQPHVGPV